MLSFADTLTKPAISVSPSGSRGWTPLPPPKVTMALTRIERGNLSNTKGVEKGVLEYKIDFGPGYRIYFGKDGERLVILIGGGTKKRQDSDIAAAQVCRADYKRRKKYAPYP
jgi:putative addiction module killer protein